MMKTTLFLLLVMLPMTFAALVQEETSALNKKRELDLKLKTKDRQQRSCQLNICFAIDGSGSISSMEFAAQKDFVSNLVAILPVDVGANFAAVQYGLSVEPVSSLTSEVREFVLRVNAAAFLQAPSTNIAAGIDFCAQELFPKRGEAVAIVLLTDGRSNFGENPVDAANRFREEFGGEINVVGVERSPDSDVLLELAGGKEENVFSVDNFLDAVSAAQNVQNLFDEICG